jgi:hypothetical protein
MKARIKLKDLEGLPKDYAAALMLAGVVVGEHVLMPVGVAARLRKRFRAGKPAMAGLGDLVHRVAMPIAKALKLDCVDEKTQQLRKDSPCAKRRERWNKVAPFRVL